MKTIFLSLLLLAQPVLAGVHYFDNTDSQTYMTSYSDISLLTNKMSFCFWLSKEVPAAGGTGYCFSKGTSAIQQWTIGFDRTNGLTFFFHQRGSAGLSQWQTSAGVFNRTNTLDFHAFSYNFEDNTSVKWYINGVAAHGTGAWVTAAPTNGPTNSTLSMHLGVGFMSSDPCGGGPRWTGYYSEVSVWNTILTFEEFELIRKSHVKGMPKQVRTSNLKCYLPLDSLPNNLSGIEEGQVNATEYPERALWGRNFMRDCAGTGASDPRGAGERVCSYYPNE